MPKTVSATYREKANATGADELPLLLLEISHPQLAQPARVVNDNYDLLQGAAALNPADIGAGLVVSGNTLTKSTANTWRSARATRGASSGKWYWEVTVNNGGSYPNTVLLGIGKSNAPLTNWLGSDAVGWAYQGYDGHKLTGGSSFAYGAGFTTGDVIGVLLDMDAGTISYTKNNVSPGVAFSGLSGTLYPMFALYKGDESITVNFGATPFRYALPDGYGPLCAARFVACAFRLTPPDDREQGLPRAQLAVDNIGRELTDWIEQSSGGKGATVRLMQVLRSAPDTIEWDITLDLLHVSMGLPEITGELGYADILNLPAIGVSYRPDVAPGLF